MTDTAVRPASPAVDWGVAGVTVTAGPVPEHLDGATYTGPVDAAAPGRYLLRLPTVGRFLVEGAGGGARVTVQAAPGASPADVACLLAGPVRQACWLLRGSFALRGCGVVIAGRAVAITGSPAAGKSAVAAALAQRGHRILADGALPVHCGGKPGGPVAQAADTGVQLWPDSVDQLGLAAADGEPIRPGLAKRRYPFDTAPATPLALVVVLHRRGDAGAPSPERLSGGVAVESLMTYTAMRPLLEPFGLTAGHFAWSARLARDVRVVRLLTDKHRRDLPDVADIVQALVGAEDPR